LVAIGVLLAIFVLGVAGYTLLHSSRAAQDYSRFDGNWAGTNTLAFGSWGCSITQSGDRWTAVVRPAAGLPETFHLAPKDGHLEIRDAGKAGRFTIDGHRLLLEIPQSVGSSDYITELMLERQ
jgi:hypothetical protein